MQFSKISVAAISMVLFSLASAAPATQAAPLEPRANCYAQAVADGSSCVVGCVTGNETGGCIFQCNISTVAALASCTAGGN